MDSGAISEPIDQHLDGPLLIDSMLRFTRVPTGVPPGHETFMTLDDPKLVHYVQEVISPDLERLNGVNLADAPSGHEVVSVSVYDLSSDCRLTAGPRRRPAALAGWPSTRRFVSDQALTRATGPRP